MKHAADFKKLIKKDMTRTELKLHLTEIRRLQGEIRDLRERIDHDRSDDATSLVGRYETIGNELRYALARDYDAEK